MADYNATTGVDAINAMYDAQKQSKLTGLENAYQQNLQGLQTQADQTAQNYTQQANELAAQYERNRRNNNLSMANAGLNVGTGAQARLAQSNAYIGEQNALGQAAAQANTDAQNQITQLENTYRSNVAQAVADSDYNRANALYNEYQNQAEQKQTDAQTLASYGDFSGYAGLYGDTVAANMEAMWASKYPDAAYYMGKITAGQYKSITGKNPNGTETYTQKPQPEPSEGLGAVASSVEDMVATGNYAGAKAEIDAAVTSGAITAEEAAKLYKQKTGQEYVAPATTSGGNATSKFEGL